MKIRFISLAMSARLWLPLTLAVITLGAFISSCSSSRENENVGSKTEESGDDKNVWRFAPDVSLPGGRSQARSVVFSPDGRTLAVSTLIFRPGPSSSTSSRGDHESKRAWHPGPPIRCEIQFWDVTSRKHKKTLLISDAASPAGVSDREMAFSRDGRQLLFWGVTTSTGIGATVWDINTSRRLSAQRGDQYMPAHDEFGVPLSPWISDRQLANNWRGGASSANGLWHAGTFIHPSQVYSGMFIKVWRRAAIAKPWQVAGTLPATTFDKQLIYRLALSYDGKIMAVSLSPAVAPNTNIPLHLFETNRLRLWKKLPSPYRIIDVAFSPDGRYVLGCGGLDGRRGGVLAFWNLKSSNLEHTVSSPNWVLRYPVFSPDGRRVAAVEGEATVFVCKTPFHPIKRSTK